MVLLGIKNYRAQKCVDNEEAQKLMKGLHIGLCGGRHVS
jgi:hypothetical protein